MLFFYASTTTLKLYSQKDTKMGEVLSHVRKNKMRNKQLQRAINKRKIPPATHLGTSIAI